MEMLALLLVTVLVCPAAATPIAHKPLNHVIDLASNLSKSFTEEHFVEDVGALYDAGCNDDFFCKVEEILKGHPNSSTEGREEKKLLRNLTVYNRKLGINCAEILKTVKKSSQKKPMSDFLNNITKCSKQNNFNGPRTKTVESASN
ncbi:interleukin-13 [Odontesthes bonariensis]|uniref:interleukin-13 n=1 Tax=Odontesthes bonariensis TaxID=219752 RepID=UPI003F58AFB9